MHLITARAGTVQTLRTVIERCHLDVEEFVVSSYAAGLAALVEDETDLGVTVLDMGAGTTDLAVFYDGRMIFADTIPVGGGHVTNDIARGLSTPISHAERLKTLHGNAIASILSTFRRSARISTNRLTMCHARSSMGSYSRAWRKRSNWYAHT